MTSELIVISIIAIVSAWHEYNQQQKYDALLDRYMAKSLHEYKHTRGELPKTVKPKVFQSMSDEQMAMLEDERVKPDA